MVPFRIKITLDYRQKKKNLLDFIGWAGMEKILDISGEFGEIIDIRRGLVPL